VWGDGSQTVDLIHVDDIARILVAAVNLVDNQIVDAGTGVALTVNAVAEYVLHVTNSMGGIQHLPMRDGEEPTHIVATGEGWEWLTDQEKPVFTWGQLADTVRWYRGK
jgi:UDP-glucose 4-epimerase